MCCKKLPNNSDFRVPHMGWSQVSIKKNSPLFLNHHIESRYYFVHSYYMECLNQSDIVGTSNYGIEFTCAVQKGNIFGAQFHPEKSLRYGKALMKAFSDYQPL
jgi:glutamine amidotransferase